MELCETWWFLEVNFAWCKWTYLSLVLYAFALLGPLKICEKHLSICLDKDPMLCVALRVADLGGPS